MSSKLSPKIAQSHIPAAGKRPSPTKAPLGRRLGAYIADWFAGDLFAAFPVAMVYSVVTGKSEITGRITDVPGGCGLLAGVLCLCFIFLYYIFIPWKVWNGQTIGKKVLGIRMEALDGTRITLPMLLLRQAAGLIILENGLLTPGRYIGEFISLAGGSDLMIRWWGNIGLAAGIISGILIVFTPLRRGLHDYLAGTQVVLAKDEIDSTTLRK